MCAQENKMLSLGGKKIRKSPRSQEKLKVGAGCIINMQLIDLAPWSFRALDLCSASLPRGPWY